MHQKFIINQILWALGRAERPRMVMPLEVSVLPDFIARKKINRLRLVEHLNRFVFLQFKINLLS
jgi:hypothetical protein